MPASKPIRKLGNPFPLGAIELDQLHLGDMAAGGSDFKFVNIVAGGPDVSNLAVDTLTLFARVSLGASYMITH